MCGICGIYNTDDSSVSRVILLSMTDAMMHRGPDGSGQYINDNVGLGHRRLSIIDLGGGAQPLGNEDGAVQVVFNGEIYNFVEIRERLLALGHRFATRSDTEVIVHAYEQWGEACLNEFNGIFAFALYDVRRRRLFLARDHLGVKPLYYVTTANTLIFASEIKSLLQHPACQRSVDQRAMAQLFTFRYVPSPDTLFAGVKKLPPGHYMTLDANGLTVRRYWDWVPPVAAPGNRSELIEQYQELLDDSVRLQLRSDVPVGLFLSSGIDSSVLLALMRARSSGPLHTFTIGFEDGSRTNETDAAEAFAKRYDTCHHRLIIGPDDYERYFERYLWDIEEPVGNETAAAFHFVSALAHPEVKVVLCGQGADEPWAGYHRHLGIALSGVYGHLPRLLTNGVFRTMIRLLPRNERLKRGVESLSEPDGLTRLAKIYSFYTESMKKRLFQPWFLEQIHAEEWEPKQALAHLYDRVRERDPLTQMLFIDTRANLPDDLLMVSDKTSMANSLEARVPFLDRRLVEFIESVPVSLKLRGFTGKYLHKKALEKWLPKQMVYQKKKGFANPIDQWFGNRMLSYVERTLLSSDAAIAGYCNQNFVREMISRHKSGRDNFLRHLYLLLSFELWHRQFIDRRPVHQ